MAVKKSVKSQQKKAKTYQSNKITTLANPLEVDINSYQFKYIVLPNGKYSVIRMSSIHKNSEWGIVNLEIDYKKLRAWKTQNLNEFKQNDSNRFTNKYKDIDLNI